MIIDRRRYYIPPPIPPPVPPSTIASRSTLRRGSSSQSEVYMYFRDDEGEKYMPKYDHHSQHGNDVVGPSTSHAVDPSLRLVSHKSI